MSPEFADAVAVARGSGALLVSDDLFLEELAANEWAVKDVSSEVSSAVRVAAGVLRDLWSGPAVLEHVKTEIAAAMRLVPQYERALRRVIEECSQRRYRGEIIP